MPIGFNNVDVISGLDRSYFHGVMVIEAWLEELGGEKLEKAGVGDSFKGFSVGRNRETRP